MKKSVRRNATKFRFIVYLLLAFCLYSKVQAFTYTNFSTTSGLSLVGNATQLTNIIRLTSTLQNQSGAVWYVEKQLCASGFSTSFRFRISNPGSTPGIPAGGDGIAFSIQNVNSNTPGTEYGAYSNNIGITFNTFFNPQAGEPSGNFVGIITNRDSVGNGFYYYTRDLNGTGIDLKDGNEHNATIQYNGTAFTVSLDGLLVITNLPTRISAAVDGAGKAWVGFSARTGGAYENHDILSWSFGPSGTPPTITQQPQSQKINEGGTVLFNVAATGSLPLTYQWVFNGSNLAGATNTSLTITNLQFSQSGNYSVSITNAFGFAISSTAFLTINRLPTANQQSVALDEDTAASILLTATDLDNDPLTFTVVTGPAHGILTGVAPALTYSPATNYFGPDSFTFKANDGLGDSVVATVSITVRPVNDAPVAQSQTVSLDEDTTLAIRLSAQDVDGDPLTFMVKTQPLHGSLTGSAPDLIYHPSTNYFGPDSFSFVANDGHVDSAAAQVIITVRPVNDAPVAVIRVSPVAEFPGTTGQVVIARNCESKATVVLDGSGSSDVENDPLTYAWLDGTNAIANTVVATNQFEAGVHEITLNVSDGMAVGTAKVTVKVITLAEAVGLIIDQVEDSSLLPRAKYPLIASLNATAASFARCNLISAKNQMEAFANKVQVQVSAANQDLAGDLKKAADEVIENINIATP